MFFCTARAGVQDDFLAARAAYQKGKQAQFTRLASRVPDSHLLKVYLDYWQLKGRDTPTETLIAFANAHPDTPLSNYLRQEAARRHGKQENWQEFRAIARTLPRLDTELRCYDLRARLTEQEADALNDALKLWHSAQDLPSSCKPMFTGLIETGALSLEARLARLRLALEAGNLRLARELLAALPKDQQPRLLSLDEAAKTPEKALKTKPSQPADLEIWLHALNLLARLDPQRAAAVWDVNALDAPEAVQHHGCGIIAQSAARQHKPEAVGWYLRARDQLSDQQRLWRIRAMLRAGRWLDVFQSIVGLPDSMEEEAAWRYWKARALRALNADYPANQLFAQLSKEINYYGLLAYEELPVRVESQAEDTLPSLDDMAKMETHPGIARALLMRKLNLDADAAAEWEWAVRTMDDPSLLAAAELARRAGWYDRAIMTAERTRERHSLDLRYLTPFRDLAEAQASQQDLDPAWVYGLMRQESRFVDYARSSVGAQGLMQIMPATAKWIADKLGLDRKAHARMQEPAENIRFGTYYLRQLLDSLEGSPVLATAGYNAGPGRARRWQSDTPLEGAIYMETIPFAETREYVKKVMANAMYYSRRLGLPNRALKERLGVIPARVTETDGVVEGQ